MKKYILFVLFILCSSLHAEKIPIELFFNNPQKTGPQISPDGTKLSYLAPNSNNVLNVFLENGKQITQDTKRGIRSYVWHYDNNHILYVQDKDGDENWHLFQTNIATGKTTDLTPFDGVKAGILAYEPELPNEMLITLNKENRALFDVYRLRLDTAELRLDTKNPGDVVGWTSDHRLSVRASLSYTKDANALLCIRNNNNTPWKEFLKFPLVGDSAGIVSFSKDDQSLLMTTNLESNTTQLVEVNLATGKRSIIAQDPKYDLSAVEFHPKSREVIAVGVDRERFEWFAIAPELQPDFDFLQKTLKTPFSICNSDVNNTTWIIASSSSKRPTYFYRYHRLNQKLEFLWCTIPELEKYTLCPMQPIAYQTRDGMTLEGYLTLPDGKEAKNLPTILVVHGGPQCRDSYQFNPQVQWLSNRGYAVLQINYRGSSGYGKEHRNAGDKEWGRKMHTDLLDGKKWLIDQGIADPSRVAIYGGSYGGYATLAGLAFTPDEFCCGVDIVGISNLISFLETIPPYWKPLKIEMDRRIGSLEKDKEMLVERSPLFKVNQIKKPLFIVHGANDPRVKQAESDQIVAALKSKGLDVTYMLFPDEGHGFARPENRLAFYREAEKFLNQHMK